MSTEIAITYVEGRTALHHQYPGQSQPQGAYVELDCETGALSADWNGEIGNAVPARVWHGHTRRWTIPALKARAANALLDEIEPLAQRVCDGYSSEWDGSNHVARFDDDAAAALEEIHALCDGADSEDAVSVWDAADWYAGIGSRDTQRAALGITGATTDEELAAIVAREEADAEASCDADGVEGIADYLERLRDEAGE